MADEPPSPRPDTATNGIFDFSGGEEEVLSTIKGLKKALTASEQENARLTLQLEAKERELKRLKAR